MGLAGGQGGLCAPRARRERRPRARSPPPAAQSGLWCYWCQMAECQGPAGPARRPPSPDAVAAARSPLARRSLVPLTVDCSLPARPLQPTDVHQERAGQQDQRGQGDCDRHHPGRRFRLLVADVSALCALAAARRLPLAGSCSTAHTVVPAAVPPCALLPTGTTGRRPRAGRLFTRCAIPLAVALAGAVPLLATHFAHAALLSAAPPHS